MGWHVPFKIRCYNMTTMFLFFVGPFIFYEIVRVGGGGGLVGLRGGGAFEKYSLK